jgi:hypothetical protein
MPARPVPPGYDEIEVRWYPLYRDGEVIIVKTDYPVMIWVKAKRPRRAANDNREPTGE